MFEVLMEANSTRGNFSMGMIQLKGKKGHATTKRKGVIDFDSYTYHEDTKYIIGHVQAPTSAKRTWEYDTSHPFQAGEWAIFHNGVITNDKELRKSIDGGNTNPVDTSTVALLLQQYSTEIGTSKIDDRVEAVRRTLSSIEGTFGFAIVYLPKNEVYIARQGSILHYNDAGDFSTISGNGYKPVPEGVVLSLRKGSWDTVGTFECTSPFLVV